MRATLAQLVFIAKHKRSIVYLQSKKSVIQDLKLSLAHQVVHVLI
jgi:hypothetical protein